jgi:hypothetical protein
MTLDWQTIVVTVVALGAAGVVLRRFLPAKRKPGAAPAAAACEHCETGAKAVAASNASTARTQTTAVVSVADLRGSARESRRRVH